MRSTHQIKKPYISLRYLSLHMRTFLINLDKDKDRLAAADAQLKKSGISYERFTAIYAKELPQEEIEQKVNYFRWWCCLGREILPGEVGCALSHYSLYQKMIDENIPYACILEDDIVLESNFKPTLNRVEQWLDAGMPQVVLLSNHSDEPEYGEEIRKVSTGLCTESYIITQPAAKALLKENFPICVPCDHWGRWVKHGAIHLYLATPSVCRQNWDDFESNMANDIHKVSDMNLPRAMAHYAMRLIGKTVDKILCLTGR